MGKIVSLASNKGGVGKTTVAVNLGYALLNRGYRVLIVDVDHQCNATKHVLGTEVDPHALTLRDVFTANLPLETLVFHTPTMDLIANQEEMAAFELEINREFPRSYYLLRDTYRLAFKAAYDFVLIDCPPNIGAFTMSALLASDAVCIPVAAGEIRAVDGMIRMIEMAGSLRSTKGSDGLSNPDLKQIVSVVNKVDKRTLAGRSSYDVLVDTFGSEVILSTAISMNEPIKQAEAACKPVIQYDPKCAAAVQFRKLAMEFADIFDKEE